MKFRTLRLRFPLPLAIVFPCIFLVFFAALSFAQPPVLDAEEQAFLKLINDYRTANGLGTLQVSIALTNSSQWMSNDMATKNYFGHTDSSGRDPFTRMRNFGYDYNTWMGENLAAGYSDAVSTFNQWKTSPPHNENMLNPNYKVIGIGRVVNLGAYYSYYWTTDLGGFVDAVLTPGVPNVNTVSAASYGFNVAPDTLVSAFGTGLGRGIYNATSVPLPKSLGGTSVTVNNIAADLLYVSSTQINYVLPSSLGLGTATVEVKTNNVVVGKGIATIDNVAPGLFTITADGRGIPAGYSTFDGVNVKVLFNPDGTSRPVEAGTAQRPDYLVLFGTGFRKRASLSNVQVRINGIVSQVDYAGLQGGYVGLDQLNIVIPTGAGGSGEVDLILTVDGKQANKVRVNIGN